jgi:hypothetical protein
MPTHALPGSKVLPATSGAVPCPKCGKALVDPTGLGWCSGCGYCKSLTDEPTVTAVVEEAQSPPRPSMATATAGAVRGLPLWFWVLLLVVAQAIGLTYMADRDLPPGANLDRAVWCTGQIAAGLALMFFAQCWLLLQIAPEVAALSFKDAVFPFKLYPLAFKRLPKNQISLWAAAFGATIFLGAFVWIGGLDHWLTYVPSAKGVLPAPPTPTPHKPGEPSGAIIPVD